jgi:CheY-like chemotaxis protein
MDGFEFLTQLRKQEKWSDIPVVVLTSRDLAPADRARLTGQVERILQKGAYTRDALLREVRAIVSACAPALVPKAAMENDAPSKHSEERLAAPKEPDAAKR